MNRKVLYFKSTKILTDAYQNEVLVQNNWGGCIDAHLIAANMGYTVAPYFYSGDYCGTRWEKDGKDVGCPRAWGDVMETKNVFERRKVRRKIGERKYKWARKCLSATGYSYKELKEIMQIFDACYDGKDPGKNILQGLKAVLARLKQIHQVTEKDLTITFKKAFDEEKEVVKSLCDEKYGWWKLFEEDRMNFTWSSYHVPYKDLGTVKVIKMGAETPVGENAEIREASLS